MASNNSSEPYVEPRRSSLEHSRSQKSSSQQQPASPVIGRSSESSRRPLDHESFLKYGSQGYESTSSPGTNAAVSSVNCNPTERTSLGHNADYAKFDLQGKNVIHHENIYLKPVYHTTVRHIEIEEVQRVTTVDRHIHHIQYHSQGVVNPDPVEVRDRSSYYELVDPTLSITQSEPIFHAPVHHKLQYQPVTQNEFLSSGSAIRPGSEVDHHHDHVSIGGAPRGLPEGTTQESLTSRYESRPVGTYLVRDGQQQQQQQQQQQPLSGTVRSSAQLENSRSTQRDSTATIGKAV